MIVLDTCGLLRLANDPAELGPGARRLLAARRGAIGVSAITAFEIALLVTKGRIVLPAALADPAAWYAEALRCHGLRELPVTGAIAAASVALPPLHQDPADRMIVATALLHAGTIVTSDQTIPRYPGVTTVW